MDGYFKPTGCLLACNSSSGSQKLPRSGSLLEQPTILSSHRFIENFNKSCLIQARKCSFLSFVINFVNMTLELSQQKVSNLRDKLYLFKLQDSSQDGDKRYGSSDFTLKQYPGREQISGALNKKLCGTDPRGSSQVHEDFLLYTGGVVASSKTLPLRKITETVLAV